MSATRSRVLAAAAIAAAMSAGYLAQGTFAAGTPANKVGASAAVPDELYANAEKPVLTTYVKINNPTDLILNVSAECAITTAVTNSANGPEQTAFGQIEMFVRIDGKKVPVATDTAGSGTVVFCNRAQSQKWVDGTDMDDTEDALTQKTATRTATAFNWMALNVGSNYPSATSDNVHKIELVAIWKTTATADAEATAIVGQRTMVLEPVKAAHGATVVDLG